MTLDELAELEAALAAWSPGSGYRYVRRVLDTLGFPGDEDDTAAVSTWARDMLEQGRIARTCQAERAAAGWPIGRIADYTGCSLERVLFWLSVPEEHFGVAVASDDEG